jgi:hypothetical protein
MRPDEGAQDILFNGLLGGVPYNPAASSRAALAEPGPWRRCDPSSRIRVDFDYLAKSLVHHGDSHTQDRGSAAFRPFQLIGRANFSRLARPLRKSRSLALPVLVCTGNLLILAPMG